MIRIPNWCHDRLRVEGPPEAVAAFVEKVRLVVEVLNSDEPSTVTTPLTFNAHVPQPSPAEYVLLEERQKVRCTMCGGLGVRPASAEEASAFGAEGDTWKYNVDRAGVALDDRPRCNVCQGSGKELPFMAGWYGWCTENWGTKWDANFDGPFVAIGSVDMDVSKSRIGNNVSFHDYAIYDFTTAWGPPTAWLKRASELEPELTLVLEYAEPGNDFAGRITAVAGDVTEEELEVTDVLEPEELWF